jgi:hypothetical protein
MRRGSTCFARTYPIVLAVVSIACIGAGVSFSRSAAIAESRADEIRGGCFTNPIVNGGGCNPGCPQTDHSPGGTCSGAVNLGTWCGFCGGFYGHMYSCFWLDCNTEECPGG